VINLPTATGAAKTYLQSDGANPQQTSWAAYPATYAFYANAPSNPADGGTNYIGCATVQTSSQAVNRCIVTRTGTITDACVYVAVATVLGSGESATASVRLNNTTDTTISSAVLLSSASQFYCATLSIAVVQGDYFEIKIVFPTWNTNPTGVRLGGTVIVQ
jgi:hypothetical protein